MLGRSHLLIGASAAAVVAQALDASLPVAVAVGGVSALAPDIDHPNSTVGRLLPRWWHHLTPGHRGPTHSLAWCAALGLLLTLWTPLVGLYAAIGALSHVAADGVTEQGVPWAWPFSRRRHALPRLLAIKTGGPAEALVVVVVVAATGRWLLLG